MWQQTLNPVWGMTNLIPAANICKRMAMVDRNETQLFSLSCYKMVAYFHIASLHSGTLVNFRL